ncbi:MAG: hypothetical protein ABJC61_03835 [Acidobacteriota bacterium]
MKKAKTMKKTPLRICVDRVIPLKWKADAAALAVKENPANGPRGLRMMLGASAHPVKMALYTGKRWKPGRTLGIRFLDGSKTQRSLTEHFATMWLQYANIGMKFGSDPKAEVRVSFQADPGSWSAVGTDCLLRDAFPLAEPTVNFGWLRDDTEEEEYRRVVLHEFGHALAAIHEHQNPRGGIRWNEKAVYDYFSGPPNNWSKEDIDFNILQKYKLDQLNATAFDPKSIMLYSFPPELIQGGKGTRNNNDLSTGDRKFIARMYAKA